MIEPERQTPAVVLFVDDEEKSRKYFWGVFGEGREILTASNGREALEADELHVGQIGIVMTDQIMPRLTGIQLLEELQAGGSPVVRILSTAYTDSEIVHEAAQNGLIDYLVSKPWDVGEFEGVLQQAEERYRLQFNAGPSQGQVA